MNYVGAMSYGRNLAEEPLSALYEGDRPLRLGSQALDILVALVERAGELVSKGELMARVWPDTFVDESNIKVQVAALRRALRDGEKGSGYISTVAGRGYWFVAPVARSTI
jgi:DNA-binding winged helix-turn-helix (wHTH) protein